MASRLWRWKFLGEMLRLQVLVYRHRSTSIQLLRRKPGPSTQPKHPKNNFLTKLLFLSRFLCGFCMVVLRDAKKGLKTQRKVHAQIWKENLWHKMQKSGPESLLQNFSEPSWPRCSHCLWETDFAIACGELCWIGVPHPIVILPKQDRKSRSLLLERLEVGTALVWRHPLAHEDRAVAWVGYYLHVPVLFSIDKLIQSVDKAVSTKS